MVYTALGGVGNKRNELVLARKSATRVVVMRASPSRARQSVMGCVFPTHRLARTCPFISTENYSYKPHEEQETGM